MGIVDRITLGSQRVTRKTINSFVGKNNFAWQELRPPSVGELTQGVQQIVTFPQTLITGRASTLLELLRALVEQILQKKGAHNKNIGGSQLQT